MSNEHMTLRSLYGSLPQTYQAPAKHTKALVLCRTATKSITKKGSFHYSQMPI